jgi:hypothetical protein
VRPIAFLLALVAALGGVPAAGGTTTKAAPSFGALLARHMPILVLHRAEQFRPVPVDGFLADSDVMRRSAGTWEKLDGPIPVGGADYRLARSSTGSGTRTTSTARRSRRVSCGRCMKATGNPSR